MCEIAQDVAIDADIAQNGNPHPRSVPSRITRQNDEVIATAWDLLDSGELSALQFLGRVKYRAGGGMQSIICDIIALL